MKNIIYLFISPEQLEVHTKNLGQTLVKLFIIFCVLTGCSDSNVSENVINIEQQVENPVTIQASKIINKMQYIALETTEESLLGEMIKILSVNDYFFILDDYHLSMFDHRGKFIHHIGNKGQGPGEYAQMHDFDVYDKHIYILDDAKSTILVYDYNNQFIRAVKFDHYVSNLLKLSTGFICYLDPLLRKSRYGKSVPDLVLFDEAGKEKKVLHSRTVNIESVPPFVYPAVLKRYKDEVLYYPPFQDTVFSIGEEKTIPKFIFNRGKYAISVNEIDDLEKRRIAYQKGIVIHNFEINDSQMLLHCEQNGNIGIYIYNLSTKELVNTSKIINDIDNTFDVFPVCLTENHTVEIIFALDLLKDKNKIPELLNIQEDDNPVLRISDLK
ncbi:MAG: 6-bladed beta-propeller [Prevotellaceae bacterium]|nr:6-bladed beta-propeller [Prevotellaceae bacterium]